MKSGLEAGLEGGVRWLKFVRFCNKKNKFQWVMIEIYT